MSPSLAERDLQLKAIEVKKKGALTLSLILGGESAVMSTRMVGAAALGGLVLGAGLAVYKFFKDRSTKAMLEES